MIRSLREAYDEAVRQEKLNQAYLGLLDLSYQLGIDFQELLKELHLMDRGLLAEEKNPEVKK